MITRKYRVFFIYAPIYKDSGSTVMRCFQLANIVKKVPQEKFKIKTKKLTSNYRNAILILSKGALLESTPQSLDCLKKRGNILIADPVDHRFELEKMNSVDIILAASKEAFKSYKDSHKDKTVRIVDHHVDPRIPKGDISKHAELRIAYFGELLNTVITPKIQKVVDFYHVGAGSQKNTKWLSLIPEYSLHYAIRKNQSFDGFKPATKILTAARCGANVIIHESDMEAIRWLGKTYPYILKGTISERNITNMLSRIQKSFNTKEWHNALRIMNTISKQSDDDVIGSAVLDVLTVAAEMVTSRK